jgi:hypothetical protein
MDLRKMGWKVMDWIRLVQDGNEHSVPIKGKEVLD